MEEYNFGNIKYYTKILHMYLFFMIDYFELEINLSWKLLYIKKIETFINNEYNS